MEPNASAVPARDSGRVNHKADIDQMAPLLCAFPRVGLVRAIVPCFSSTN